MGHEPGRGDYFYAANNVSSHPPVNDVLNSLLGALAIGGANLPVGVEGAANATAITGNLGLDGNFRDYVNKTADGGNLPKAYLNILFFDERFNFVQDGSTAMRVSQPGDGAPPLVLPNIKAPKNGYAYVYLSNESDENVFFDNLKVADERGRLIEEDHYYAYGLRIAGISSKKLPDISEVANIKNGNLYNDKELFDDGDLNWYDYGYRNYDAQIGRFTQLDPLTDDYPELTNYQYASNDPIDNIDIDGLEGGLSTPGGLWNGSFLQPLTQGGSNGLVSVAKSVIITGSVASLNQLNRNISFNAISSQVSNQQWADQVINKSFANGFPEAAVEGEGGIGLTWGGVALRTIGVVGLVLSPLKAGGDGDPDAYVGRRNRELMLKYKPIPEPENKPVPVAPPVSPKPPKPPKDDNRKHWQYVLVANHDVELDGNEFLYDIFVWGKRSPQGKTHLKKDEVWKYGTTVNPETRYTKKWLRENKLRLVRQHKGTRGEVLEKEKEKILQYQSIHGELPPGNKMVK